LFLDLCTLTKLNFDTVSSAKKKKKNASGTKHIYEMQVQTVKQWLVIKYSVQPS